MTIEDKKTDSSGKPQRFPGIDLARGLELFDGDIEMYMNIAGKFLINSVELGEQITLALKSGDNAALTRMVHSLKGMAANIGADGLSQMAASVEEELRAGHKDESRLLGLLLKLEQVLNAFREMTAEYMRHNSESSSPNAGESGGEKKVLLIVDDSPFIISIISQALRQDYTVKSAASAEEALAIACSEPGLGLILLDVLLPEMNGYELIKILKETEITQDIPIIFVSALSDAEDREYGLKLGAVDYISKPINLPMVKEKVRQHLAPKGLSGKG